ncbi:hypothetical protein [Caloramator sp. Dgby_cultured_2]
MLSVLMLGEKISFNVLLGIMFIILGTVFAFGDKLRIKN